MPLSRPPEVFTIDPTVGLEPPLKRGRKLSRRELQVIKMYSEGLEYPEMAARLGITPRSIRDITVRARRKFNARTIAQAVYRWRRYEERLHEAETIKATVITERVRIASEIRALSHGNNCTCLWCMALEANMNLMGLTLVDLTIAQRRTEP